MHTKRVIYATIKQEINFLGEQIPHITPACRAHSPRLQNNLAPPLHPLHPLHLMLIAGGCRVALIRYETKIYLFEGSGHQKNDHEWNMVITSLLKDIAWQASDYLQLSITISWSYVDGHGKSLSHTLGKYQNHRKVKQQKWEQDPAWRKSSESMDSADKPNNNNNNNNKVVPKLWGSTTESAITKSYFNLMYSSRSSLSCALCNLFEYGCEVYRKYFRQIFWGFKQAKLF